MEAVGVSETLAASHKTVILVSGLRLHYRDSTTSRSREFSLQQRFVTRWLHVVMGDELESLPELRLSWLQFCKGSLQILPIHQSFAILPFDAIQSSYRQRRKMTHKNKRKLLMMVLEPKLVELLRKF
jgi:gluconate kinase